MVVHSPGPTMSQKQEEENPTEETGEEKQVKWRGCGGRVGGDCDGVIPWTVAYQAPLSVEFSRQEY